MVKITPIRFGNKGFTLIEIMIVIGVLAILVVFGMLQFQLYHTRTYNAAALVDLQNVKSELAAYYADNQYYP
jgi:prepilin-type N-terminal cleavage/methylation domain-containing protein